jgi:hypothetical protein
MAKKSFRDNTAHLDRLFSDMDGVSGVHDSRANNEQRPPDTVGATATSPRTVARYYRFNLNLKPEYHEYLERVSWESHKSVTQYLNDLVAADMATREKSE